MGESLTSKIRILSTYSTHQPQQIKSKYRSHSFACTACEREEFSITDTVSHIQFHEMMRLSATVLTFISLESTTHEFAIIYHGSCVGKVSRTMINECQTNINLLLMLFFSKQRCLRFLGFFLS